MIQLSHPKMFYAFSSREGRGGGGGSPLGDAVAATWVVTTTTTPTEGVQAGRSRYSLEQFKL